MDWFFQNDWLFGFNLLNSIPHALDVAMYRIMMVITFLGEEYFYLAIIPIVFWCYNKDFGFRLTGLFLVSVFFNEAYKHLFDKPRPIHAEAITNLNDNISLLANKFGYVESLKDSPGFPSGHTQNSLVFFGVIGWHIRKTWAIIAAAVIILLIAFSRMYLGVHFPGDVLGGFIIGSIILLFLFTPAFGKTQQLSKLYKVIVIIMIALVLSLLFPVFSSLEFLVERTNIKILGILSGLALGAYLLETRLKQFTPKTKFIKQVLKVLIGFIGVGIFQFGLSYLFGLIYDDGKESMDLLERILYFTRNFLLGFWIVYLAPYVFMKARLVSLQDKK